MSQFGSEPVRDPGHLGFDTARLARLKRWMQRYADTGRWPGGAVLIARHGELAFFDCAGHADVEAKRPWQRDLIARIYSMTKPVTAVALMMLYEEARVHLDDPVEAYLPEFKNRQLLIPDATTLDQTVPVKTKMTIRHLLTHTSGLSLFTNPGILGEAYAKEKLGLALAYGGLDKMVRRIAELPLEWEPGTKWQYSTGLDVIGRIVEVVSGTTLDKYFATRIFEPLGMTDTGFSVPGSEISRFPPLYEAMAGGMALQEAPEVSEWRQGKVDTFCGGGGLVGTIDDYWRFAEMLRAGGELNGERILSPRTLRLAACNHLPGDLASLAAEVWSETQFDGVGFGLLGSVVLDPAKAQISAQVGDYGWGGAAGTFFWVSPVDDMVVILFTQLLPSSAIPVRKELRALVHGALTGA
ncbi:CubicO group peptidase (beta-lactamase class C family) [Rhizobium sp. BK619]|uniref:serine hydrolase domain-containing protein n=1 Tax=Rhizobium sp. BK619 TaxID=2586989 RepID=UPI00161697EA|nr:serine hydrolase domain-containing protein [Rhizobium sp. BK619]MBB3644509.1 CubicO group peptidase (beta-lactamase class C family) [Rhizobium sp. BK619]